MTSAENSISEPPKLATALYLMNKGVKRKQKCDLNIIETKNPAKN